MKRALALLSGLSLAALATWLALRSDARPQVSPTLEPPATPQAPPPPPVRREVQAPLSPREAPARVRAPAGDEFAAKNNQAVEALEAGELERAVVLLEECHAADREQAVFRRNLAEALARLAVREHERVRPCPDCLAHLERALELAPEREDLGTLLERWRREAQTEESFHRVQSVHFELAHEVWREALLDRSADLLQALELHYVELAAIFDVRPAEQGRPRIPVSLYRPAEFSRITGLAEWAGASFDGVIRAPLAEGVDPGPAFDELLRHELIHAFVREAGGREVPGWLNEGLAQWFQPSAASELTRARESLRGRELIALERLRGSLSKLAEPQTVALAYAQSLAFCAWIEREHGRPVLLAMVAQCRADASVESTFASWTRAELSAEFERFGAGL